MKQRFHMLLLVALGLFAIAADCNRDDDDDPNPNGTLVLKVTPVANGEPFEMGKKVNDNQNREYWFTTLKFYLSNIQADYGTDEQRELADVAIFDFEPNQSTGIRDEIRISIPIGSYTGISYDAGVREDLNGMDPATFSNDHPLSINNTMYWSWSTQYIFTKIEGFVDDAGANKAWFVHSGLNENYMPGKEVSKAFTITSGGTTTVELILDLDQVLEAPNTIDLVTDGQTHTTDNMVLAKEYQENFSQSFK